jgi:GT2 family glycosyltransferase
MTHAVTQKTEGGTAVPDRGFEQIVSRYEISPTVWSPGAATKRRDVHRSARPRVQGKFIFIGDEKFYIKGVTYGSFKPDSQGVDYPSPSVVQADFALMSSNGVNCIRTYTVPPLWLLDLAKEAGLRVMVGLPGTQHVTFLDSDALQRNIEQAVRDGVRACAGHPAILGFAVANEIPASIVRWHGKRAIELFIERLYRAVKEEDPNTLVTYVNFPTTAYLNLPFLDFACFNVYLESEQKLRNYLAQLQNFTGDRPLVMGEVGLDSLRNGLEGQSKTLKWQISTIFDSGCAGLFVFSWTDEWHRGGYDVEDWDFGLTTRGRRAKPALSTVRKSWRDAPFTGDIPWPRVSVIVCTYNGARTIRDCFEHLQRLDYPDFEVIVVNDGSTDATPQIADQYDVHLISVPNGGLSNARNIGLQAASGEIVAYIDDDAYPDPQWLKYLAHAFMTTDHTAVGGPNIPPLDDGPIAECVANAPGGPLHVLMTDTEAEHIPGCNMAIRSSALRALGGFDPQFRSAGDDVDLCWRLTEKGWTIGFHPAAVVWHHRRNSVKAYWKQQLGYGRAEAMLEQKWPEKYNALGHVSWQGRLYGRGFLRPLFGGRGRIYHGKWNSAPFQSIYQPAAGGIGQLFQIPEWYMVCGTLGALCFLGMFLAPLTLFSIPFLFSLLPLVAQAISGAANASFWRKNRRWHLYSLTAVLHFMQPFARLCGRLRYGLTPWRRRGAAELKFPRPRLVSIWSESWLPTEGWLTMLESFLKGYGAIVLAGSDFETWDLEVRGGLLGGVRTQLAVEEHGQGKQLLKFRTWPTITVQAVVALSCIVTISGYAVFKNELTGASVLVLSATLLVTWMFKDCARAEASLSKSMEAGRTRTESHYCDL